MAYVCSLHGSTCAVNRESTMVVICENKGDIKYYHGIKMSNVINFKRIFKQRLRHKNIIRKLVERKGSQPEILIWLRKCIMEQWLAWE